MRRTWRTAPLPKGAAGQFAYHLPMSNMLMGYSKNQKAAKEFLAWITSKDGLQTWFNTQQGYTVGALPCGSGSDVEEGSGDGAVPLRGACRPLPRLCRPGRPQGRRGFSKYIITDMYAKAVQGMAAEEAVKWATRRSSRASMPRDGRLPDPSRVATQPRRRDAADDAPRGRNGR